ncbi:hypothetical protein PG997_011552 [Apiospora hydei]|uniref:Uncharacterized protein n=1 Tax=Apiospora hydei TaxID=1337664 RepID=A0ABR1VJE0_9PEZI
MGYYQTGTPADELWTFGLLSCIAIAAVGTADEQQGIDKVMAHVVAIRQEPDGSYGPMFFQQFDTWETAVRDAKMRDVKMYLSVPETDVNLDAPDAMRDMVNRAREACARINGQLVHTTVRRNEDACKPPPFGAAEVKLNKDVFIEGAKVSS